MPNVIQLSKGERADLSKVERIDVQTGNVLVHATQELGGPVGLAGGATYDASAIHGPITVTGPGRIKYWIEGDAQEAAPEAVRGDSGGSGGGYESRTVKELRALAKERGLDVPSKARKSVLVSALREKK